MLSIGLDGRPLRAFPVPVSRQASAVSGPSVSWSAEDAGLRLSGEVFVAPVPPGDEGTILLNLELENLGLEPRRGYLDLSLGLSDSGQPLGARWFEVRDQNRTLVLMSGNRVLLDLPVSARLGGSSLFPELPVNIPYELVGGDVVSFEVRLPRSDISQERQLRTRAVGLSALHASAQEQWRRSLEGLVQARLPDDDQDRARLWLQQLLLHVDGSVLRTGTFPSQSEGELDPSLLREILVVLAEWGLTETAQFLYDRSLGHPEAQALAADPMLQQLVAYEALAALAALEPSSAWLEEKGETLERATSTLERLRRPLSAGAGASGRLLSAGSYEVVHDSWLVRAFEGLGALAGQRGFSERSAALLEAAAAHRTLLEGVPHTPSPYERAREALRHSALAGAPLSAEHSWLAEALGGPVGTGSWAGVPPHQVRYHSDVRVALAGLAQLRARLLQVDGRSLSLLPGAPASWFAPGAKNLLVEDLPSVLGRVSVFLRVSEEGVLSVDVRYRTAAQGAERLRLRVPEGRYRVNGVGQAADDGWLELPAGGGFYQITAQ